jgi:hypothetical protein
MSGSGSRSRNPNRHAARDLVASRVPLSNAALDCFFDFLTKLRSHDRRIDLRNLKETR